ncbi:MAG: mechanosensitive ion channel family protein [Bacteroidales bacterium]
MLFNKLENLIERILRSLNIVNQDAITSILLLLVVLLFSALIYFLVNLLLKKVALKLIKKSSTNLDDELYANRFFHRLTFYIPLGIFDSFLNKIIFDYGKKYSFLSTLIDVGYVVLFMLVISSFLQVLRILFEDKNKEGKSIKSLIQAVLIILWIIAAIVIMAIFLKVSTQKVLGYLGAASAVLMLVFKDTILGFVGSVQISTNDIVKLGDWIEMPNFGVDGDIIDISLVSVKVRNFDKTVVSVPTYALVSNSVRNYKPMQLTGTRRIKRSVFIDQASIKFVDEKLIEQLKKIDSIRDYIIKKEEEIGQNNFDVSLDSPEVLNNRKQTNLGIFRAYITDYLRKHPMVDQSSTLMVRQRPPTNFGLPMEIYCFTSTSDWVLFENAQSDIFDHILACVEYFDLHIFQSPSWVDYKFTSKIDLDSTITDDKGESN